MAFVSMCFHDVTENILVTHPSSISLIRVYATLCTDIYRMWWWDTFYTYATENLRCPRYCVF